MPSDKEIHIGHQFGKGTQFSQFLVSLGGQCLYFRMVDLPLPVDLGGKETPIASLVDPMAGLELRYFNWRMQLIKL